MFKKIGFYLLILIIFTISVTATRYINYGIYEGIIDQNGNFFPTATPITDSHALGFVCSSSDCATVSGTLWNGAVQSTGPDNTIQLTYPTALQSLFGYGVYYYKPGYITWEQNPNWWGTNSADPQGPFSIYLSKKQGCHAPIDTFTVINDAYPNQPIQIDITASLDATTYSAIHHAGPLDYVPPALEQYYSVETSVTLIITNENDEVVFQEVRDIVIPFSGSQRVEFTWTPTTPGEYRATATTDITDAKCSSSVEQATWKDFHVLSTGPENMCYTLINNLAVSDPFPYNGDTITITADKISNHADENSQLTPVPTDVTMTITYEDGSVVNQQFLQLPANPDDFNPVSFDFDWTIPSPGAGYYTINVSGIANSPQCQGLTNLQESEYLGLIVEGQHPDNDDDDDQDNDNDDDQDDEDDDLRFYNGDLSILGLRVTSDEYLRPGSVLQLSIYLENHADEDLENLKIAAVVHDLGISRRNGPFDLDQGDGVNKRIFLDIPEDAAPGYYSIRMTVSNDDIRRVKYRDFFII